jgi:hypothetical protein
LQQLLAKDKQPFGGGDAEANGPGAEANHLNGDAQVGQENPFTQAAGQYQHGILSGCSRGPSHRHPWASTAAGGPSLYFGKRTGYLPARGASSLRAFGVLPAAPAKEVKQELPRKLVVALAARPSACISPESS